VGFAAELLREYDTIRDAILTCAQKSDISQFNFPHGESVESVLKKKKSYGGKDLQKRKILSLE